MPSTPRFQTLRVFVALMIREMTTRYGRSAGGYIWALLEPIGMIAILSIAFSQLVRSPPVGESFVFFYATGYIPFFFYADIVSSTGNAVQSNRALMQYPMVTPLDAILARFFLSFLTVLVVAFIVFAGILAIIPESVRIDLVPLLTALGCAAVLGLGLGTLNVVLFSYFPAWRSLWSIVNRPLFIISGVFFTFESLPQQIQAILWWNPLVHVVGMARLGFYPVYEGTYISIPYVLGVGLFAFLVGGWLLMRNKSYIYEN